MMIKRTSVNSCICSSHKEIVCLSEDLKYSAQLSCMDYFCDILWCFFTFKHSNNYMAYWQSQQTEDWCFTCSNGTHKGLQGNCYWIVPCPNDKHNTKGLWLDVHIICNGEKVFIHRTRSCPLSQLADSQIDFSLQAKDLKQLCCICSLWKQLLCSIQTDIQIKHAEIALLIHLMEVFSHGIGNVCCFFFNESL